MPPRRRAEIKKNLKKVKMPMPRGPMEPVGPMPRGPRFGGPRGGRPGTGKAMAGPMPMGKGPAGYTGKRGMPDTKGMKFLGFPRSHATSSPPFPSNQMQSKVDKYKANKKMGKYGR